MRPSSAVHPAYLAAFTELVQRIAAPLQGLPRRSLPIKMYVAGGAALHLYTAERISNDVDAVFSKRIVLSDNLEVTYRDPDGIDASVLEVRLLSALDLAVSKISRLSSEDRNDIIALAKHGLIQSAALRRRSQQAMDNYVGNTETLRGGIDIACRLVEDIEQRNSR